MFLFQGILMEEPGDLLEKKLDMQQEHGDVVSTSKAG
jgi:hypothetical protein